ncbi:MAG: peptide MFS transporter [Prevotellaceae bacterium]|jgi:POT family proton-dependent oligopeptide transporter|nr:peptide MFS transporter [Prevotellaceae bacterium]
MFKNHPKGLYALALANTGERFGYYTMLAIFMLYLQAKFGFSALVAGQIYGGFLAAVYFMPLIGGFLADKFGFGKMITGGIVVMFLGYLLLSLPFLTPIVLATEKFTMFAALALIAIGTGLFKGNLQVLVGNLYDAPEYQRQRDNGFSLFYMAINIGAMFAPYAANRMVAHFGTYNAGFAVACVSLVVSIGIYLAFRPWYRHADMGKKAVVDTSSVQLTAEQIKSRIIALLLVFAVVIFFWMSFHQNGATMTLFARDYTTHSVFGLDRIGFNIWNLVAIVIAVYALFSMFQSEKIRGKIISVVVFIVAVGGLIINYKGISVNIFGWLLQYSGQDAEVTASPELFQQFNPFFVVCLTPVSMAIFAALARRKKEPSTPFKIGLGMLVAAVGFMVLAFASFGLASPADLPPVEAGQEPIGLDAASRVSTNWLISTYLILTFGELLLSPMGISFVSKVAPPKYKGMMMGCWFAATAIGNYLVSVIAGIWETGMPLWSIWTVLITLCLISAVFIFSILKRLNKATE